MSDPKHQRAWLLDLLKEVGRYDGDETYFDEKAERIIEALCYVPGMAECPKCGFILNSSILYTGSGTMTPDRTRADRACPNDGELLQPVTWYQHCAHIGGVCEGQVRRSIKAEDQLKKMALITQDYADAIRQKNEEILTLKRALNLL